MAMFTRAHALRDDRARCSDLQSVARAAGRAATSTGRCPATRTCSARSRSTSRTTCSRTSGCSGATRGASSSCSASTSELPLGAGALAGVNFATDRGLVARELGFAGVAPNSIDAVSNRDFVLDFLAAAATCATHLSRLGAEIVLWSSEEFGFCEVSRRVGVGLLDHAAEEEPRRGRAAAREGAARRRAPGRAARRACTASR